MKGQLHHGVLAGLLLSGACAAERLRTELHVSATVVASCSTSTDLQTPKPTGSAGARMPEPSRTVTAGSSPWVDVRCGIDVPHIVTLNPTTSVSNVGSAEGSPLMTVAVDF